MKSRYRSDVPGAAVRRGASAGRCVPGWIALGALPVMLLAATDMPARARGVASATVDGLRCPAGTVRIAEVQALARQDSGVGASLPIGVASAEVCETDATKFSDIVTRGMPDDPGGGATGQKAGVTGTIQIRGRTADLDANIYVPLSAADLTQCNQTDGSGQGATCKPHGFVASFAGTWVFSPGQWRTFQVGTDSAGNPVALQVRISNGPIQ